MSNNLNNILKLIKLKKQHFKSIQNKIFYINNHSMSNSKKLKNINNFKNKIFINHEDPLMFYIFSIVFSKTNTFMHVMDHSGKLKFFYSAGLFKHSGKKKKLRLIIFKDFLKSLIFKLKNFKNKPINLHLTNVGVNQYWILKRLKKKFFIKSIKNFSSYPYNGCRKKKTKRVKIRTKKLK